MFSVVVNKISLLRQTKFIMQNLTRLFIFLFSSLLFSQQPGTSNTKVNASVSLKVFGIVSDSETGEPLEYATISIKSKNNPEKIFGGISDENGKFLKENYKTSERILRKKKECLDGS